MSPMLCEKANVLTPTGEREFDHKSTAGRESASIQTSPPPGTRLRCWSGRRTGLAGLGHAQLCGEPLGSRLAPHGRSPLSGTPPPTGGRPAGRGRAPGPRQTSSGWLRLGSKRHLERCLGRHTDKLSPSRDGPGHIHYLPSAGGGDGQGAEAALLPRTLRPSPRGGRFSRKAPSPPPPAPPPAPWHRESPGKRPAGRRARGGL